MVFFYSLTCWIGLHCLKFPNLRAYHFAVDLLNSEKIYFTNSKNSYISVFLAIELLIWTSLPKISKYWAVLFGCWLVELRKSFSTNSKKWHRCVLAIVLLKWTIRNQISEFGVTLRWVCHIAVDLLNWEKKSISRTQKFHI